LVNVISVYWPQSNAVDSAIVIIWLMLSVYIGLAVVLVTSGIHYCNHLNIVGCSPWPQSYVLDFAIVIIWLMLSV